MTALYTLIDLHPGDEDDLSDHDSWIPGFVESDSREEDVEHDACMISVRRRKMTRMC